MHHYTRIIVILTTLVVFTRSTFADSITLSETWKDSSDKNGTVTSKDVGSLNASLTVPGLSSLTADDWSNMVVSINMTPFQGSEFTSDIMSDAANTGGSISATSATFLYQGFDTNGNLVNIEKITFTRSGNTFTIADQVLNPPAWQPPSSLLAQYYLNIDGPITDTQTYDVNLQDGLDDGSSLNVDITRPINITGENTVTTDGFENELNNLQITGIANFSLPTVTSVSPPGSITTTSGLLDVEVQAASSNGVANVEFSWNGSDVGPGGSTSANLWSQWFALAPGVNTFQTVATDTAGNNSAPDVISVTYVNQQTNAPVIQFSERDVDSTQADGSGDELFAFNQDVGTLNAALSVPGLQAMSANTWSNLVLSLSFGNLSFSNRLAAADVLTSTSATFDIMDSGIAVEQLIITRMGNTLVVFKRTGNPSFADDTTPLIANHYSGAGGPIRDQQPFSLTLADGTTLNPYLSVSQIIYITGSDTITEDGNNTDLDNIQVSGSADFTRPTVTFTAPTANQQLSSPAFTVTGKTTDNILVTDVFYSLNNSAWTQATPNNGFWTNWTAQVTLTPGTNTVRAYSVDSSGNLSFTNKVSFVYVLSAPLTVSKVGQGNISPNYNNDLLQIGKTFFMTAAGTNGFKFNGWTGSLTTNGATLTFTMASNLVFTANFLDTNRPTVTVTAPTANEQLSNSAFTVTGKTTDNALVTNVFYSLNNSAWTQATPTNGFWTNWTAQVTLTPGTNTVRAYSVDSSGNLSLTNKVSFVYVLSTTLTVNKVGQGNISPNYNNELLQIGKTFFMTAAGTNGFKFNGWTGSLTTNGPTLTFTMASNLVFTANFLDTNRPTITITAPTANEQLSNSAFTVTGKTTDNALVTNVFYSLNNSAWTQATPTNGFWTNWTAQVTLTPGTNTVRAYSVDSSGNLSFTNKVSFVYVLSTTLTVSKVGQGNISPNYNNDLLQIGKTFFMTAAGTNGFKFNGWTGSLTTNGATLTFTMASNLVFTANFLDTNRPTITITAPTANEQLSNSAFTVTGKTTDNALVTNVFYSLNNSAWTQATPTNGFWTNWTAQVTLTPGTNTVRAYSVDSSGNLSFTNKVSFVYVLSTTLTVSKVGQGNISPNYNNELLQIGKTFFMTAAGTNGFKFNGWTGSLTTNGPTLTFTMASNLVFTANFLDTNRPTITITAPTANEQLSNSAFTVTGKTTDNALVTNVFYSLNNSAWTQATPTNGFWTNWTAQVTLTPGTNTVRAYSVDSSGNLSFTNKVSFVYVLSTTLTVSKVGQGNISPNYNNELLQIGKTFFMTAAGTNGFKFNGWTGSLTTNGPTLTFTMASNLVFTANFLDTNRPTITITAPTANEQLSNSAFTVTGKTTDNALVTNVFYSLNNSAWTQATPTNGFWTNWTAQVTLTPGTNTVRAYSVDSSGNLSFTNKVSFVYVLSTTLTVSKVGLGNISPNYNNDLLQIGKTFFMTAAGTNGFKFNGWTGSLTTNGATLTFTMASNLVFTANFLDTNRPTITITAPTANEQLSNSAFTVTGKTTDNALVTNVFYSLNNSAWTQATPTNGFWTNWTAQVTLTPGTNTVRAYSVDSSGNLSFTNKVSFVLKSTSDVRPVFIANPVLPGGPVFTLQLSTNLGGHIQYSSDLVNWVNLTNFNGSSSSFTFRDPTATNSDHRFYRAAIP